MKTATFLTPEDTKSIGVQYNTLTMEEVEELGMDNVDITWVEAENEDGEKMYFFYATKK